MRVALHQHDTQLGKIWTHWTPLGLYEVRLNAPERRVDTIDLNADLLERIDDFDRLLCEFCADGHTSFADVTIDPTGWTDFSRQVYECCRTIPAGETWTYKQLAAKAGNEKASRAVGAAMARNRVLLVIPCHRVVASSGELRGFSAPGGLVTKQRLLDLESRAPSLL